MGETIWSWEGLKIRGDTHWAKVIEVMRNRFNYNQFKLHLALAEKHQGAIIAQDDIWDFEQRA